MILTPDNVTTLGDGLDHPECVCVAEDGTLFAGGEAGQVYRFDRDGAQHEVGTTGGFLLGIALDGAGNIHACDIAHKAVMRIDPDGKVTQRSTGAPGALGRPFEIPNYPVFDAAGNLYVSESGEYFHDEGTGAVLIIRPDDTTEVFHAGPFKFTNGLAIDPSGQWLYIVQSTAPNIARVPIERPGGPIEITHQLPYRTVPDGLAFAADGRLIIACYKPDGVYVGHPDGRVELLCEDPTGELLCRPTNAALHGGRLYLANLGGWHITALDTDMQLGPMRRPRL